MIYVMIIRCLQ